MRHAGCAVWCTDGGGGNGVSGWLVGQDEMMWHAPCRLHSMTHQREKGVAGWPVGRMKWWQDGWCELTVHTILC
eukprot:352952-Chlamydomonas_euryale.AAC.12